MLVLIRFYQYAISPWLPKNCRYEPTCSQYMVEALKLHGPFKGLFLGTKRLLRCNPFTNEKYTYDPVPKKKNKL